MIECVCVENTHLFDGNPLYGQHQLRYKSIIERQSWDVPTVKDAEYDSYDNPAAHYLVKRDNDGKTVGVSRLYPTDRPYMLEEVFPHLVTKIDMPHSADIWEGSRFCIEKNLSPEFRKKIVHEIVVSYLEFCLTKDIRGIVGVMYPAFWKSVFINAGWNVEWIGDISRSTEGYKIQAGFMRATQANLERVRDITNIHYPVLSFGQKDGSRVAA